MVYLVSLLRNQGQDIFLRSTICWENNGLLSFSVCRFRCSSCKRSWASAQVQILCHMHLDSRKSQGQVLMRLFAQRCQKCSRSQFEKPEFSPDSTMRILNNLVQRIQEKYYTGGVRKFREMPVIPELPLEGSHDMANCEACVLGFCIQNLQNCMTVSSTSPPVSMESRSLLPHIGDMCGKKQAWNKPAEAEEAQGSGYFYEHNRSGPSHATAGTKVPRAGKQSTQGACSQTTQGAGLLATRGTDPIQMTHPTAIATRRSGTPSETKAVQRRQEKYSPRGHAFDSFHRPPPSMISHGSIQQDNLFKWGIFGIAALCTFLILKCFK